MWLLKHCKKFYRNKVLKVCIRQYLLDYKPDSK